jgi:hypothetical protein
VRTDVAPILLAGLFAVAGLGVLHAIRPFAIRPIGAAVVSLVAATGLAYLVGVSVVGLIAIALLILGVSLSLPGFTLLALAVAGAGTLVGALRRPQPAPARTVATPTRADRLILIGCAVLFAAFALVALAQYTSAPMVEWDSWSIWTRKAIALFSFHTLVPDFWSARPYTFMHQDYPILLPMLEMLHFRAIGRQDVQSVHVQLWLLLVAFPWALGYIASRSGRAAVWAPIALGAVAAPSILTAMIGGLADVPLAVFLACGILSLGLWIERRNRADLALAAILLAAAASIKNEGIITAVVAFAAAAIVLASERPRRALIELGCAAGAFVLAIAPWQLWVASHDILKEVKVSDALDPGYLFGRADRVWPSVQALSGQVLDEKHWSFFVPLAIVTAVVALMCRRATRAAAFYLIAGAGSFVAVVWAFWAASGPVDFYIGATAFRVVGLVVAVAMAAVIHLAPRLADQGPLAPGLESEAAQAEAARRRIQNAPPGQSTAAGASTSTI